MEPDGIYCANCGRVVREPKPREVCPVAYGGQHVWVFPDPR